jgi:hypothetical protein
MQIKTTESPDFYTFTQRQAIAQYVYQTVDRDFNIFGGQIPLVFGQDFDQV